LINRVKVLYLGARSCSDFSAILSKVLEGIFTERNCDEVRLSLKYYKKGEDRILNTELKTILTQSHGFKWKTLLNDAEAGERIMVYGLSKPTDHIAVPPSDRIYYDWKSELIQYSHCVRLNLESFVQNHSRFDDQNAQKWNNQLLVFNALHEATEGIPKVTKKSGNELNLEKKSSWLINDDSMFRTDDEFSYQNDSESAWQNLDALHSKFSEYRNYRLPAMKFHQNLQHLYENLGRTRSGLNLPLSRQGSKQTRETDAVDSDLTKEKVDVGTKGEVDKLEDEYQDQEAKSRKELSEMLNPLGFTPTETEFSNCCHSFCSIGLKFPQWKTIKDEEGHNLMVFEDNSFSQLKIEEIEGDELLTGDIFVLNTDDHKFSIFFLKMSNGDELFREEPDLCSRVKLLFQSATSAPGVNTSVCIPGFELSGTSTLVPHLAGYSLPKRKDQQYQLTINKAVEDFKLKVVVPDPVAGSLVHKIGEDNFTFDKDFLFGIIHTDVDDKLEVPFLACHISDP